MKAKFEMSRCIGWSPRFVLPLLFVVFVFTQSSGFVLAGQFETLIRPLVADHCVHCHEGSESKWWYGFRSDQQSCRSDCQAQDDIGNAESD